MKETDLKKVKMRAKLFLYLDYEKVEELPSAVFVHHPFLSSTTIFNPDTKEFENVEDETVLDNYHKRMLTEIDKSDLIHIFMLMNTPYHLAFIKYIEPFLSDKDLAELFADAWVATENPNQDANCSISYLTKLIKRCDKHYLMTSEDYEVYQNLPEQFTIYRGVAVGRARNGLSWTRNKEKAIWFANRFNTKDKSGYLLTTVINKSDVLAYFNTRGEEEIVVNVNSKRFKKERIELNGTDVD